MKKEILIIIILYKKKIKELSYLNDFKDVDIFFYDNSPRDQKVKEYYYKHEPKNLGVSKGYNEGIKLAKKLNKKYVLLLDQDTVFTINLFGKYLKEMKKYKDQYIYAPIIGSEELIYSPGIETAIRNICQKKESFRYEEKYELNNKTLINSGLMIPIKILEKIGCFNEKIKLDFSDTYFIEKYKKYKSCVILLDLFIEHSLSGNEGKDEEREINRFKFFCNGAKEFSESIENKMRINRLIFFRMTRLIIKYRSFKPILLVKKYYVGEEKI